MGDDGIIVKEEEHTTWASPVVVIDKDNAKEKDTPPSKDKVRICINLRDLNKALERHYYLMFTGEQVVKRKSGSKISTFIDVCTGCWQLQVDDESSKLLAFNTQSIHTTLFWYLISS